MRDPTSPIEPGSMDQSAAPDPLASSILTHLGLWRVVRPPEAGERDLLAALAHPEWPVRLAAVQTLAERGKRAPLEPMVAALRDEQPSVRAAAARALGKRGEQTVVAPLVAALHDAVWQVRTEAALALGKLGLQAPVEPLLGTLGDADESVRAAALWALGEMRERAPIEPLVVALRDRAWLVREAAALALRTLGERAPVAPLLAAQQDSDGSVRTAAGFALVGHMRVQPAQAPQPPAPLVPAPGWRVALAIVSLLMLVPLSLGLELNGRGELPGAVGRLIALGLCCVTIVAVNMLVNHASKGEQP